MRDMNSSRVSPACARNAGKSSALNALGFPRDEFYEVLKGNRPVTSSARLPLEALLLLLLTPFAILLTVVEAAFGGGATLECVARRRGAPEA